MKSSVSFFLFPFLLLSLGACEEHCAEVECANDPFLFTLFREDGMDLLNDPDSGLKPESVRLYFMEEGNRVDLEVHPQQNQEGRTIAFQTFLSNEEVTEYFFSTNLSLSDTISLTFEPDPVGCCPSMSIGAVYQNGKEVKKENSGYSFLIPAPDEEE